MSLWNDKSLDLRFEKKVRRIGEESGEVELEGYSISPLIVSS